MNSLSFTFMLALLVLLILTAFLLYIFIPVIVARSPYLMRKTLFTTGGEPTHRAYYDRSAKLGVRNFYVTVTSTTGEHITMGIYHYLPKDYTDNQTDDIPLTEYDYLLRNSSYHVLLIFHGRGQSRASFEAKYDILSRFFHVLVFDYRCFGDSTVADLTEIGIVGDCVSLYKWLRDRTSSSIFVWGQSLGSALCIETVFLLDKEGIQPKGMILESSFTSMREAVVDSPVGNFFSWMPWFSVLLDGYEKNGFLFNSSIHLSETKCPVMIMHSADDDVIPFRQGLELYEVTMRRQIRVNIAKFLPITAAYGCGHDFIYKFPNFTLHIMDFINVCDNELNTTSGT